MKIFKLSLLPLLFLLGGALYANPVRIMPMGDSITNGSAFDSPDGTGGYRGPLYNLLTGDGYNVDYIGTLVVNSGLLAEPEHEGHGGWRIDQLDANVEDWFNQVGNPHIILLHIGTNDFGQGFDTVNAINRYDALLTKIWALSPDTHVIVTNLMERNEPANGNIVAQFNPLIQGVVTAQAAAGNLVSFLDMRALVPLSDMPDDLHPDQNGYDKMAAGWKTAVDAVWRPGDGVAPAMLRARSAGNGTEVIINFNKGLDQATAENVANYAIDNGVNVLSAALSDCDRIVTLTTDQQVFGVTHTLTVNGVEDEVSPTPNTIAANSTEQFVAATPRGYFNNVEESDCYTLVYSIDLADNANYATGTVPYDIDHRSLIGSFDRIAYYLELQTPGGDLQYAWASMDAFSSNLDEIGVPAVSAGVTFQESVSNLNVESNVPGVTLGAGQTGNIEFWPSNYNQSNTAPVPGASDTAFDFGDGNFSGAAGYGCMQVHNTGAAQTVIAFNRWGQGTNNDDLGIGNQPTGNPDWTFAQNAGGYEIKTLQVLVRTLGDVTPPTLVSAVPNASGSQLTVGFSEPIRPDTFVATNFALDNGVDVQGVSFGADLSQVVLQTSCQPPGTLLTLTVNNLRDTSQNANEIAPGSTIAFGPTTALPPEVVANIGAASNGYELLYTLEIPDTATLNAGNPYLIDNSAFGGSFSRVAYYLELQVGAGPIEYVWAAMDAFTTDKGKLGVPTVGSGAFFQQLVTNLDVISNKAGIVNGTGIATGNIEFWPSNYNASNGASIPGANASLWDFGDGGAGTGAGYGSMQVHNHGASQTLFALNHFGVDGGHSPCLGIGNNGGAQPDWTFEDNANTYSRKVLHVMVLPSPPPSVPANVLANVPEAANYDLVYTLDIPGTGNLSGGAGFQPYSVDLSDVCGSFDRVAYYMELQTTGDPQPTYAWVSMPAFTGDRKMIGVPNLDSGATWRQFVTDMTVVSNSGAVTNGTGLDGNLEFWPTNYQGSNTFPVPGASGSAFDFGDNPSAGNYGSMQVHNYVAGETIFALNRWGETGGTTRILDVGIGNRPADANTDWTFAQNASSIDLLRRLHVFVRPAPAAAPQIVSARGSAALDNVLVSFDQEVSDSAAVVGNFAIDGGLAVTGATLQGGNREILLTTSAQTPGQLYTVSVSGVRGRSPEGTLIAGGANAAFTAYVAPAVLANVPDADMELIYCLAIPAAKPAWNNNSIPYSVDETSFGEFPFDRVAYLIELDGDWAYASFDPHTDQLAQVGVPTLGVSATAFQQVVTNMNVASNVGGIVTGSGITTGNIEFWGGNYGTANALGLPGADGGAYDFDDTMAAGGYGCMQIHNYGAAQTVLAYNSWGSSIGGNSDAGIGNNTGAGHPDYTFSANAASYSTRNLYVLARRGGSASGPAPEILTHPCDREVAAGGDATFSVSLLGDGPFTFQWRCNGVPLAGATSSWLSLSSISSADVASYDVVVTGPNGVSVTSLPALLTLTGTPLTPIELWRIANGYHPTDGSGAGEGNLDIVAPNGFTNLENFAFGLDKDGQGHGFLPTIVDNTAVDGMIYFEYPRIANFGAAGISFEEEFSRLLSAGTWEQTPSILPVVHSTTTGFDGAAVQIVREEFPGALPVSGGKARNARLRTTLTP